MTQVIVSLFKISRPRFWFYLAGPFLLGLVATNNLNLVYSSAWTYILLLFFLWPANFYLYGINDYFDQDTDQFNLKKTDKESQFNTWSQAKLIKLLLIGQLIFSLLIFIFLPNTLLKILFFIFIFLATFYSAPPLRFKKHPLVDSLSNVLYVIPGFISYALITGQLVSWLVIIAAWAWSAAMHLFSAIPDIEPDKQAKLKTSAILWGEKLSLFICLLLWSVFFLIINQLVVSPLAYLLIIYPIIPASLLIFNILPVQVYWYFPWVNSILGFLFFWYLVLL